MVNPTEHRAIRCHDLQVIHKNNTISNIWGSCFAQSLLIVPLTNLTRFNFLLIIVVTNFPCVYSPCLITKSGLGLKLPLSKSWMIGKFSIIFLTQKKKHPLVLSQLGLRYVPPLDSRPRSMAIIFIFSCRFPAKKEAAYSIPPSARRGNQGPWVNTYHVFALSSSAPPPDRRCFWYDCKLHRLFW
jgi:hypothetical protein